jgi:hypothetical protein
MHADARIARQRELMSERDAGSPIMADAERLLEMMLNLRAQMVGDDIAAEIERAST